MLIGACVYGIWRLTGRVPAERQRWVDGLHFFSAGAASFARGLNDTPKMVALLLLAPNVSRSSAFLMVSAMIAIGALVDARKVAETLGKKITEMNAAEGLVASLVTAGLVSTASLHSLPVSTTHVSVGSLLGVGVVNRQAHWHKAAEIVVAWLSTVPCAALLASLVYWLLANCG
jgi:PiT family inorganic phosphate transporter